MEWSRKASVCLLIGLCAISVPSCSSPPPPPPKKTPAPAKPKPTPSPVATASASPTAAPPKPVVLTPEEAAQEKLKNLVKQGMDQVLLGHHEESLPFLQEAYQIDPTYAETHYWMFKAYQKLEPEPAGLDAPGPTSAREVVYHTDMVSWRTEAEAYLATVPTAQKSALESLLIIEEEGAKEPPPPPPPPPGTKPQQPKVDLPRQP